MAGERSEPVVVPFPLRGEGWVAVTSPADRVPSHGTDMLGQRFAYDFLITDERPGQHYHPAGWLRMVLLGVPTRECYAWGAPVHAMFDCDVIRAVDGHPEPSRVHPIRESLRALRNSLTFSPARLPSILGNHVIVEGGGVVAAFVHLAPGSVAVHEGQRIGLGDVVGRVGHTGNSTSPHLHVQLMDSADPVVARGIPCAFAEYEVLRGGAWEMVRSGIPSRADRIRLIDPPSRAE